MNKQYLEVDIEAIKEEIPLGKIGAPENISKCINWLIEDNYTNRYITENWFANSIIDLIDWKYYGVEENLSLGQREL